MRYTALYSVRSLSLNQIIRYHTEEGRILHSPRRDIPNSNLKEVFIMCEMYTNTEEYQGTCALQPDAVYGPIHTILVH
jgi:hypothetical protein